MSRKRSVFEGVEVFGGFFHHQFHILFAERAVAPGDFVVDVVAFFSHDLQPVSDRNSVKDVEEVLFLDQVGWQLLLAVDLRNYLLHTAATRFSLMH